MSIIDTARRLSSTGLVRVKKYSPEILTGVAVVGVVATAVLAVRASKKAEPILSDLKMDVEYIREDTLTNTPDEVNKEVAKRYVRAGVDLAKVYGPTVTMGATTVIAILSAHNIAKKRYVAMAAAYKVVEANFAEYRERMIEELGEEREAEIRSGHYTKTVTDENGKKTKVEVRERDLSNFSRVFDESNPNWQGNPDFNDLFLRGQQNYLNDMLRIKGHVMLNHAYERLGIPIVPEGYQVGWSTKADVHDGFVDLGLDRIQYKDGFSTYDPGVIPLEFNHDGYILDKI